MQPEKQMLAPEGTEPVLIFLPKFPGWQFTGEYRRPRDGEYFLYCGKVDCSSGRQALPYHIMRRAQPQTLTEVAHHGV